MAGEPPEPTDLPPLRPVGDIACPENPMTTTADLAAIAPETSPQADCDDTDPSAGGIEVE